MMDQENYPNQNNGDEGLQNLEINEQLHMDADDTLKPKKRQSIVLKFKKRMYDGDQEALLVERMEKKYRDNLLEEAKAIVDSMPHPPTEMATRPQLRVVNPAGTAPKANTAVAPVPLSQGTNAVEHSPRQKAIQAICLGPLEICVSILGIITSIFALVTFACFKNEELNQHSRVVLQECKKAFVRGIKNTFTGPVKAWGHLTEKQAS